MKIPSVTSSSNYLRGERRDGPVQIPSMFTGDLWIGVSVRRNRNSAEKMLKIPSADHEWWPR
jgi:hypothetical protein